MSKDDTWEMLMFKLAQEKHPKEMLAIENSILANRKTIELADKTINQFKKQNIFTFINLILMIINLSVFFWQIFLK